MTVASDQFVNSKFSLINGQAERGLFFSLSKNPTKSDEFRDWRGSCVPDLSKCRYISLESNENKGRRGTERKGRHEGKFYRQRYFAETGWRQA